jgi:hypothetical protein
MTTASLPAASQPQKNLSIAKYLGPPPLIDGEDPDAYRHILDQMTARVIPQDAFEEVWLRDIVDLTWEAVRWRRYAAALVTGMMRQGALEALHPLLGPEGAMRLSNVLRSGKPETLNGTKERLGAVGLSIDAVAANTLAMRMANLGRLDFFNRLAAQAEARRNAALSEIAGHRKVLANLLRKASDDIIQAEFEEVAPAQVGNDHQLPDGDGSGEYSGDHADKEDAEEQAGG